MTLKGNEWHSRRRSCGELDSEVGVVGEDDLLKHHPGDGAIEVRPGSEHRALGYDGHLLRCQESSESG